MELARALNALRARLRVRSRVREALVGRESDLGVDRIASGQLEMGRRSYDPPKVVLYPGDQQRVIVGNFTSIAGDVVIVPGGNHPTETVSMFPFRMKFGLPGALEDGLPWSKGDVVIGSDVWIGRGARIMGGVTIGHGAVVAAYTVVTKSVKPYEIVAGAPARHVRFRFEPDVVEALLAIAWWDWPDDKIIGNVERLTSPDIAAFLEGSVPLIPNRETRIR